MSGSQRKRNPGAPEGNPGISRTVPAARRLFILAILVLGFAALGGQAENKTVSVSELESRTASITGKLGSPLSTFMTIEGTHQRDNTKAQAFLVSVDTVDGKKLKAAIVMEVRGIDREEDIPVGSRCTLRGYEWGTLGAIPADPEVPLDQQNSIQQRDAGFYDWFEVTKVISPAKG